MLETNLSSRLTSRHAFYAAAEERYNTFAGNLDNKLEAIRECQAEILEYRTKNATFLSHGTRQPDGLLFEEAVLLDALPAATAALPQAKRNQALAEAKLKSPAYRTAQAKVLEAENGLDDLREKITQYSREIRSLELAIGFVIASLDFLRK